MMRMPSWSKKPAGRAAIWATVITLIAIAAIYPEARHGKDIIQGQGGLFLLGVVLLCPGIYMMGAIVWVVSHFPGTLSFGDKAADSLWFTAPVLSWIFYFTLCFFLFRWRARRKAARESAAAQGTSPNVA